MKTTTKILSIGLLLLIGSSCSKKEIEQDTKISPKKLKTFAVDDDCPRTETVSHEISLVDANCGGGTFGGYSIVDVRHESSTDCNGQNEITRNVPAFTLYSRPCNAPGTVIDRKYTFPTVFRVDDEPSPIYVTPFNVPNIEYWNQTYLTANPSVLILLRNLESNIDIAQQADMTNIEIRPNDPYVRDEIYWALYAIVLRHETSYTIAYNLANNVMLSPDTGQPHILKSVFLSYIGIDADTQFGGIEDLQAIRQYLENRMEQGSF